MAYAWDEGAKRWHGVEARRTPLNPPSERGEKKEAGPLPFPPLSEGGFGGVLREQAPSVRNTTVKRSSLNGPRIHPCKAYPSNATQ